MEQFLLSGVNTATYSYVFVGRWRQDCIQYFIHSAAANGLGNFPRPFDWQSVLRRWEQGLEANALAGIPKFVTIPAITSHQHNAGMQEFLAALIDEVINGNIYCIFVFINIVDQVPLAGNYPARLARATLRLHGTQWQILWCPYHNERMVPPVPWEWKKVVCDWDVWGLSSLARAVRLCRWGSRPPIIPACKHCIIFHRSLT